MTYQDGFVCTHSRRALCGWGPPSSEINNWKLCEKFCWVQTENLITVIPFHFIATNGNCCGFVVTVHCTHLSIVAFRRPCFSALPLLKYRGRHIAQGRQLTSVERWRVRSFNWRRLWLYYSLLLYICFVTLGNRNSVVGVATGYGLDGRGIGVWVPVAESIFIFALSPDWICAHWHFYPMDIWDSFPWGIAAGAWSWPLTSDYCLGQEYVHQIRLHGAVLN
jgi:hypothetical protein